MIAPRSAPAQGRPRRSARGYRRFRVSMPAGLAEAIVTAAIAMSGITADVDQARTHLDGGDLIALLEQIAARVQHVGIEAYHGIIGESGDSLADTVAELDGGASQKMRKILDADRPRPRPVTRAASSGSNVLAWDTSRWPSADMVILGQRTAFFTWKVPSARRRQVLQQVLSSQAKGAF
jgi:hypothetical protein